MEKTPEFPFRGRNSGEMRGRPDQPCAFWQGMRLLCSANRNARETGEQRSEGSIAVQCSHCPPKRKTEHQFSGVPISETTRPEVSTADRIDGRHSIVVDGKSYWTRHMAVWGARDSGWPGSDCVPGTEPAAAGPD